MTHPIGHQSGSVRFATAPDEYYPEMFGAELGVG